MAYARTLYHAAWLVAAMLWGASVQASEHYADLLEQARKKSSTALWKEATPLWQKVVQANPVHADHWAQLADAQYRCKDYPAAIAAYQKALELGAGYRWAAAYNIACCYSLQGEQAKALEWLEKALRLGYRNLATPLTDDDLKPLRADPRFLELLGANDVTKLSRVEGWRYDLKLLHREILRKHPNPHRQQSRDQMDGYVKKLHDDIPSLSDPQIEVGLMKLARMAGDGHTFIRPGTTPPMVGAQFYLFEEGVFLTAVAPELQDLAGAQVLKVGGLPIAKVLTALDSIVCQDNSMGLKAGLLYLSFPRCIHGLGLIPTPEQLPLTVKDATGQEREVTLPANKVPPARGHGNVVDATWVTARKNATAPDPLYLKQRQKAYWFEYLPEEKLVYCQYNGVRNQGTESLAQFCTRMFQFINGNAVEALVLDLRWNGGGNSFLNRALIHGLIRCDKINQRGKLFVIIGRQTFSAAQNCTTDIEMHTNAMFVGEPTGSCPNFIGESVGITLPHSKMTGSISDLNWVRSWPMDQRCWIAPHLYAPPVFALYKANRDPALEAILSYRHRDSVTAASSIATPVKEEKQHDLWAAVVQLNKAMEEALRKGDLQGVANFYADDGVLVGPNGYRVAGRKAIDAYWTKLQNPKDWRLEVLSVEGDKGVIVQRGRSRLVVAPGGQERISVVEFVLIWHQQKDGTYKIAMDAYW